MKVARLTVLALVLACAPAAAAAEESARLSDMARAARESAPAGFSNTGPGSILASLAATENAPSPCATPLVDRLLAEEATDGTRGVLAALQARPAAEQRVIVTRDGRFAIHVPSGPREIDPEWVARVSEALVTSRAWLTGTLGWPDPSPGPERTAVFVSRLGAGLEGYAAPPSAGARPGAARSLVIDATLPRERILPVILHQTSHLSLADFGAAPEWWSEATASYLALAGSADRQARETIGARLERTAEGLATDHPVAMEGGLLWPLFLSERASDPTIVRQIWQAQKDLRADPLLAADHVLRRRLGFGIEAALREMAVWNLFTGRRDNGAHYPGGRDFAEAPLPPIAAERPGGAGPLDAIEPTGSLSLRIPADRARGALSIGVDGRGGRPGADLLIFYRSEGAKPVLVPIDLSTGSAAVSIPWTDAREAWIVLRNQATAPDEGASRFDLTLDVDPRVPFDLAAFSAAPIGRGIVLEWTTAAERGLLGWNVYRSESPTGPFVRLNGVAVPAYGDGAADTGYVFADESVRPGRRYYYQVEGITSLGLPERSHTASARVEAAR